MAIKELLKEELDNSLRMEQDYQRELAKLPRGSIVKKVIGGRIYFYLAYREKDRVRFQYMGKKVDEKDIERYSSAKKVRRQYRHLLSEVRRQIKFLRKVIRAKQAV